MNRFWRVFQFYLYIRGCHAGQYLLFYWIYCQNSPIRAKALEIQGYWCNRKLEQRYVHRNATQHIVSTTCVFEYRLMHQILLCLLRCRHWKCLRAQYFLSFLLRIRHCSCHKLLNAYHFCRRPKKFLAIQIFSRSP